MDTPLSFRKKSWHFHIASKYGGLYQHSNIVDLCTYICCFILGLIVLLLISIIFAFQAYILIVNPIAYLIASFNTGIFIPIEDAGIWIFTAVVVYSMITAVLFILFLSYCYHVITTGNKTYIVLLTNSTIFQIYKSIKDKFCISIKLY